jgi:hypothetical protein
MAPLIAARYLHIRKRCREVQWGYSPRLKVEIAVQLIEYKPLLINPLIAEAQKLSQATLFEFAIHHVVGVWVLVEAR